MSEKSDVVMGTQVSSNEGWQERCKELCDPDAWQIQIVPSPELFKQLSGSEITRMQPKIELVKEVAQYMLAGMLKGTVKYPDDNHDLPVWLSHLLGEGADFINYIALTLGAFRKD